MSKPGLSLLPITFSKEAAEWIIKGLSKVGTAINKTAAAAVSGGPTTVPSFNRNSRLNREAEVANRKVLLTALKKAEETIEKAMPFISPSSYAVAWTHGTWDPRKGALIIGTWDPRALVLAVGADMATLAKGKPALRATGNAAVDVAARAGSKAARAKAVSRRLGENVEKSSSLNISKLSESNFLEQQLDHGKNSGVVIHYDKGDGVGSFGHQGAYIKNGMLHPGASAVGLLNFSWWNIDKPYMAPYNWDQMRTPTRYIIKPKSSQFELAATPGRPAGQWDGTKGFVIKSEFVTDKPVDLSDAIVFLKDPLTGSWGRVKYQQEKSPQLTEPSTSYAFTLKPRIRKPLGFGKIQSTPTIQNRPAPVADPLITRLMRLQNKKDAGIIPKTDLALIIRDGLSDALIEDLLVKAYKRLGIEEKDARETARYMIKSNSVGEGSYFPVEGDNGLLLGGISYVDRLKAIDMLKRSGITNPTEADIRTILGHELGHLVETPGFDKEFYTLMGLILDNEGITAAKPNMSIYDLVDWILKYLTQGRLDNGISARLELIMNMKGPEALRILENILRYSMYSGGAYLLDNMFNKDQNS